MIINTNHVTLSSQNKSFEHLETKHYVLEERKGAEIKIDTSVGAQSVEDQIKMHEKEKENYKKQQEKENQKIMLQQMKENQIKDKNRATGSGMLGDFSSRSTDFESSLLRLLLKALNRALHGKDADNYNPEDLLKSNSLPKNTGNSNTNYFSLTSNNLKDATGSASNKIYSGTISLEGSKLVRTEVTSAFYSMSQNTAFEGKGQVQTADGRSIDFNVSLELSQSFCHEYASVSSKEFILCDPLVINLGNSSAKISDQKFLFDLDCDGKKDEISFTEKGSGFLALDKNDDGVINDGSELFGTKSNDGFKDLAKYDSDGNGWIDEADEVFNKLKIWTKDENGNDKLLSLKEADVGAIYLGSAKTTFSLYNNQTYNANGQIQKTGIFLKESGGAGTLQHVDLAI